MTKPELIQALFEETGVKKADLKEIMGGLAAVVQRTAVKMPGGDKIVIPGVCVIRKRLVPAKPSRMGRNPATGETVRIPAKKEHMDLKVKPDTVLKEAVLGKRAKKSK